MAKFVSHTRTNERKFDNAVRILELAISKASQDLCVAVQSSELQACRERIGRLKEIRSREGAATTGQRLAATVASHEGVANTNGTLVDRALEYIASHYLEQQATLAAMSRELGVTEKHLTSMFTRAVGQRMHAYIVQLRVEHACRLIVLTDKSIKQVAYESGFRRVDTFRRSFHRHVGVAPGAYRTAFRRG